MDFPLFGGLTLKGRVGLTKNLILRCFFLYFHACFLCKFAALPDVANLILCCPRDTVQALAVPPSPPKLIQYSSPLTIVALKPQSNTTTTDFGRSRIRRLFVCKKKRVLKPFFICTKNLFFSHPVTCLNGTQLGLFMMGILWESQQLNVKLES